MTEDDLLAARADLFGSIFVVVQHLTRRSDAELADLGLTTRQWLLLAVLARGFEGRRPSLSEAAAAYGSSRQNVKKIALGLEERGWLRLVPDPDDGRTTRIELTGRVAVFEEPRMQARAAALLADVCAGLSREDTLALSHLVHRWLAGLTARPAD